MDKTKTGSGEDNGKLTWKFAGIVIVWLCLKIGINLAAFSTRIFPFSLLFVNRPFHVRWIGADRIIRLLDKACREFNNRFIEDYVTMDDNFYYVSGRFKKPPVNKIFTNFARLAKAGGYEIMSRGEVEPGLYKFMAPLHQKWQWTWY